jgi:putative aldouronate transport system permease protein
MVMESTKKRKSSFKSSVPLLLLTIPALLYFIINNYIPMFGIFIAFKNLDFSKGIFGSDWCGLQNFAFLFKTNDAWIMTRNTILYNLVFIVLGTVLAIALAILVCEITNKLFAKLFQSALILPNLISMVIVSYIGYAFLNSDTGLINNSILKTLGAQGINWYMEPSYWPFILTLVYIWKMTGYTSIIYVASISGMDKEIYEAAKIDGAGKLRQIASITLPLLKPTVVMLTLMSVGRIMSSDFGLFYQVPMNSGALYSTTQTIDTYVYRGLMQMQDFGMSSAAGVYQSLVGFILVMVCNYAVKKVSPDDSLF